MSPEELAAIRARLDAASPGPWRGDCESGSVRRAVLDATGALVVYGSDHDGDPYHGIHEPDGQDYEPNATLIVNAPTDLAALLDEVARLEAERDAAMDEARRLRDLVRHQRGPLHDAELITDAEYAALAADAGAVARLRGYDELRRESRAVADALEARAKELDIAADTQDAYTEGPDDAVRVETLRRAASIVRGGR